MTALFTTENGFDKAAIMRRAHVIRRESAARYAAMNLSPSERREVTRELRSAPLRSAWAEAHNARFDADRKAEAAAVVATIPAAERIDRAARLDREAYRLDRDDRNGSAMSRVFAMQTEAAQLRAA